MNVSNVSREDQILGGLAVLLVIDLLFLPWFSFSFGPISQDFSASGAPDGWLGILAVLAALALIVDLAVERFSPATTLPAIGNSRTNTRFILACAAAVFVVLKFLFHVHFSYFGFGFYLGIILTAALVFFARQARGSGVTTTGPV